MILQRLNSISFNHLWPIWLILSGFVVICFTFAPIAALLSLFHDDSFFYLVIARNHAAGLGYSFDGLNATNGFHPLWLWMLSYLGLFIELSDNQGIRAVVAFQTILSLITALLYIRILSINKVSRTVQVIFFLFYIFLSTFADIGQESAIYSFIVALIITVAFSFFQTFNTYQHIQFGLIMMILGILAILSRLDSIFLLGGITLALLLVRAKIQAFGLGLGIVIGVIATFGFNYYFFGHFYSISSWLKSGFDLNKTSQILIPGIFLRVTLIIGLLGAAMWRLNVSKLFRKKLLYLAPQFFIPTLTLCIFIGLCAYYIILFLEVSALGSWYFNQALGLSGFLYALSLSHVDTRNQSKIALMPLMLASIIGMLLFLSKALWSQSMAPNWEMGTWIKNNLKDGAIIFQRDGAGAVSYFAQRPIINGDGLVNNMQYQILLRSGKLCEYLENQKVEYLISNTEVNDSGKIQDYIFLWTKGLTSLPLTSVSPSLALFKTQAKPHYRIFHLDDAVAMCTK